PGALTQVVREGDVIDVDPGVGIDNRTVKAGGISFNPGADGEDGLRLYFNSSGVIVCQLAFTDNSTGIFTSTVPEPASVVLFGPAALLLLRRRRGAALCL